MRFLNGNVFKILISLTLSGVIIAGSVVSPALSPQVVNSEYVDAANFTEVETTQPTTEPTTEPPTTATETTTKKKPKKKYKAKKNVKVVVATGDKKKDEDKGNDKVIDDSLKEPEKVPEKDKIEEHNSNNKPIPVPETDLDNDNSKYEDTDDFVKSKFTDYCYADKSKAVGWKQFGANMYYFDNKHNPLKGIQRIKDGGDDSRYRNYYFNDYGAKASKVGIDVSRHNGKIDWNQLKKDGIDYAIVRVGFRGYGTSSKYKPPLLDNMFEKNMQGAKDAGIPVGLYFFSQAITVEEAMEEAGLCVEQAAKYDIKYPIYFDTEFSNPLHDGRADGLTKAERTEIAIAFCESVKNAGYTPGVYASKSFYYNNLDFSQLTDYQIWVAHYTKGKTDFKHNYRMWQYTSSGSVNGINGRVDMNIGTYDYVKRTSMKSYGKNTLLLDNEDFKKYVNAEKAVVDYQNDQTESNRTNAEKLINALPNETIKKALLTEITKNLGKTKLPAETNSR